jgi:hypothetical protein
LKRGQEPDNQRARTGSRCSRTTWSFSHKSRLILKENSPCVSFFSLNETIINGRASKAFERCLRRTLSAELIPCRCELHLSQSKRKKVCSAEAHHRR